MLKSCNGTNFTFSSFATTSTSNTITSTNAGTSLPALQSSRRLYENITCFVCLNTVKNPVTCRLCESTICENCLEVMKIAGKSCFQRCSGNYKKAHRHMREFLSYSQQDQNQNQEEDKSVITSCVNVIKKQNSEIVLYESNIRSLQLDTTAHILRKAHLRNKSKQLPQNKTVIASNSMNVKQKRQLYEAVITGNVEEFKILTVNCDYPILEEISAHPHSWTSLHYAMHYGQGDIITYILSVLQKEHILKQAMIIESSDGRCPLLSLIQSNALGLNIKQKLLKSIFSRYKLDLSSKVMKELISRKLDNLVPVAPRCC